MKCSMLAFSILGAVLVTTVDLWAYSCRSESQKCVRISCGNSSKQRLFLLMENNGSHAGHIVAFYNEGGLAQPGDSQLGLDLFVSSQFSGSTVSVIFDNSSQLSFMKASEKGVVPYVHSGKLPVHLEIRPELDLENLLSRKLILDPSKTFVTTVVSSDRLNFEISTAMRNLISPLFPELVEVQGVQASLICKQELIH